MVKYKTSKDTKILVCTAWPYIHDMPHLGNLVGSLLSGDVFSRYYKLRGFDTIYVSGSDSHGARMEHEAAKRGVTPEKLVFDNHKKFKKILKQYGIDFDNYTITHNPTHHEFVRAFYKNLEKEGYLIKKDEKQVYCKNCDKFLAERFIIGTCPYCRKDGAKGDQCDSCGKLLDAEQLINPTCATCGKSNIELKETTHWYLDLPKLEPKIKKYVKSHPEWTGNVKNFTESWLKEGLRERAITRDMKWGIPAPFKDADNKVIYVWAEAVLGYVSAVKELFEGKKKWLSYWQGDNIKQIHTIGKDNIPFHSIIFPALLIANSEKWHLPDQISSTEFLNWIGGDKFSKTNNTGIFVDDALEILPALYWRFYLLYNRPEKRDVDFSWDELDKTINDVLIANIGNLVNRTLTFTQRYFKSEIPVVKLNSEDRNLLKKIDSTAKKVESHIENDGSIRSALFEITRLSADANKYFQEREPWKNEKLRANTVYVCLRVVKALSIFLAPYIPSVSEKVWKILNTKPVWDDYQEDFKKNQKIGKPEILVEKIDKKEIMEKYESIKGKKAKEEEKDSTASFHDFEKLKIKIGTIKNVEDVSGSDKLYKLTVDTGEMRTLIAGIKSDYRKEELIGKQIVVVANLEPRKLRGIESQGMLLAADDNGKAVLLQPEKNVRPGTRIK